VELYKGLHILLFAGKKVSLGWVRWNLMRASISPYLLVKR
jgi:hypothetical protein